MVSTSAAITRHIIFGSNGVAAAAAAVVVAFTGSKAANIVSVMQMMLQLRWRQQQRGHHKADARKHHSASYANLLPRSSLASSQVQKLTTAGFAVFASD